MAFIRPSGLFGPDSGGERMRLILFHKSPLAHPMQATNPIAPPAYEIRFQSIFDEGRGLSFPCNAKGQVDLDVLSEHARANYLYARAVVGREYLAPAIAAIGIH
ncbi:MAG: hypothetical protein ABIO45_17730 [Burkholderiaceae bacterium]